MCNSYNVSVTMRRECDTNKWQKQWQEINKKNDLKNVDDDQVMDNVVREEGEEKDASVVIFIGIVLK